MTTSQPKVWDTPFFQDVSNMSRATYQPGSDQTQYLQDYEARQLSAPENVPKFLYFNYLNMPEKKKEMKDFFMVNDGIGVVSERFHDLLLQFDLGSTKFFEVPLFEKNQKDQRPGRYFILHIAEQKSALVPEESGALKQYGGTELWYSKFGNDEIALKKDVALSGADLWADPDLDRIVFFSDRLKVAVKENKIATRSLKLKPTKLVSLQ